MSSLRQVRKLLGSIAEQLILIDEGIGRCRMIGERRHSYVVASTALGEKSYGIDTCHLAAVAHSGLPSGAFRSFVQLASICFMTISGKGT